MKLTNANASKPHTDASGTETNSLKKSGLQDAREEGGSPRAIDQDYAPLGLALTATRYGGCSPQAEFHECGLGCIKCSKGNLCSSASKVSGEAASTVCNCYRSISAH
eukprot:scaffold115029_cov31-Tisochrysis_lutea.AAC.2